MDDVVFARPQFPVSNGVSAERTSIHLTNPIYPNLSEADNGNHDVAIDNTISNMNISKHTQTNTKIIETNKHVNARKHSPEVIPTAMGYENKMSICIDGTIDAGVNVTIDQNNSSHVDKLNRNEICIENAIAIDQTKNFVKTRNHNGLKYDYTVRESTSTIFLNDVTDETHSNENIQTSPQLPELNRSDAVVNLFYIQYIPE